MTKVDLVVHIAPAYHIQTTPLKRVLQHFCLHQSRQCSKQLLHTASNITPEGMCSQTYCTCSSSYSVTHPTTICALGCCQRQRLNQHKSYCIAKVRVGLEVSETIASESHDVAYGLMETLFEMIAAGCFPACMALVSQQCCNTGMVFLNSSCRLLSSCQCKLQAVELMPMQAPGCLAHAK